MEMERERWKKKRRNSINQLGIVQLEPLVKKILKNVYNLKSKEGSTFCLSRCI